MARRAADWRVHAIQRAAERYGIEVTADDLAALVAQVKSRKAECLTPQSETKVLRVEHRSGIPMIVIYARGRIVTFLPKAGWE